jgi:uncharacterized DUF497 family protein
MFYDFQWDNRKANSNKRKHGISFRDAASVFLDPRMLVLYDNEHSSHEDRWLTLGLDHLGRVLVVSHLFKLVSQETALVRIISARRATVNEIRQYQEM